MSPPHAPPRRLSRALARFATFGRVVVLLYRHERPATPATAAEIHRVDAGNVDDASAMEAPGQVAEFHRFLERGDVGYYGYVGGRVVHRSWVRRGPLAVPLWHAWGRLALAPDDAYIHYCATDPAARGMGIYPAVLARAVSDAREAGARTIFIFTELENAPSRRGIEKAGFVEHRRYDIQVRFGIGTQHVSPAGAPQPVAP